MRDLIAWYRKRKAEIETLYGHTVGKQLDGAHSVETHNLVKDYNNRLKDLNKKYNR
jgi:hypothetical protein